MSKEYKWYKVITDSNSYLVKSSIPVIAKESLVPSASPNGDSKTYEIKTSTKSLIVDSIIVPIITVVNFTTIVNHSLGDISQPWHNVNLINSRVYNKYISINFTSNV